MRSNVVNTKLNYQDKVRNEVGYVKQEKQDQKDFMQVQKHQEQIKNHSLK